MSNIRALVELLRCNSVTSVRMGARPERLRTLRKYNRLTALVAKVTHFGTDSKALWTPILTYILSRTDSELSRCIGQIIDFDTGGSMSHPR